jgi:predicted tellurium resistance membrane protein TerC
VIWGAGLLARLMNRWTWIVWLGGGFLAYVAAEMVFEDRAVAGWLGTLGHRIEVPVSIGLGLVVAALGWWLARRPHAALPEDI